MSRLVKTILCLVLWTAGALLAQSPGDEATYLVVLQSGVDRSQMEDACQWLKLHGTVAAVPTLAGLLADVQCGLAARDALEALPCPEAGLALLAALDTTSGLPQAGIIDTLRTRHELVAVPRLIPLLAAPDAAVAAAAAAALGSLATPISAQALLAALGSAPRALRPVCADALLCCAEGFLRDGSRQAASELYGKLIRVGLPDAAGSAAWAGLMLSAEAPADVVAAALASDVPAASHAVLERVNDLPGIEVTRVLATALPRLSPTLRPLVLGVLARRGDPAALGAVSAESDSSDLEVRLAALGALAELGDESQVTPLLDCVGRANGPEREAARVALSRLHRGDVDRRLLVLLTTAAAPAKAEIIDVLARRGSRAACSDLLTLAGGQDETAALAALQALAELADSSHATPLATLTRLTATAKVRDASAHALVAIAQRVPQRDEVAAAVILALAGAAVPARCTLLRAAGEIGGTEVLAALRTALADPAPEVRETALRTVAERAGLAAAPDLLRLGREAPTPTLRVLAMRGYWRVVGLAVGRPTEERLRLCRDGWAACERPEEKRLGLAELAKVADPAALEFAVQISADAALRAEVELAAVQLAQALLGTTRPTAENTLRRLAVEALDERTRTQAQTALNERQRAAVYIMPWLAAGPYRQEGKECSQLFDIVFPPEVNSATVQWKPAVSPPDPALFWQVDLAAVVSGNHAVAYLRTRVFAPHEQPVALALGVDDGVKLWINGLLVHANNAVRGLSPDEDKANGTLRQGWNDLLAKVTQHTAGCGICVRLTTPAGGEVEGLRVDPFGKD